MAANSNGKMSLPTAQAADSLISGGSFSSGPNGTAITYSFRATAPSSMPDDTGGFSVFNPAQIRGVEMALQAWADVANIQFQRIGSGDSGAAAYSDQGVIRFANYSSGAEGSAAFSYLPTANGSRAASSSQGDGWYNSTLSYNQNPVQLGYGQKVLIHEIGHALGLEHPSDYEGAGDFTYANSADFFEDSRQFTVMSYFSESNTGGAFLGKYATTPLVLDIAAIQKMYGANMSAFLGDTVYGFNSNADRPWLQASGPGSQMIFCAWDAGGNDTFDFSGYSQAQTIDLNPTAFSSVGGMRGNVSIAEGVTIENVVGGSGADTIVGNAAGNYLRGMNGDDSIFGGAGDDNLNGNQGSDTVDGGEGADTVRGGQGDDVVFGGAGDDPHVNGNLGNDTVYGGLGNDTVFGGQGDDKLFGEDGADLLSGDLGDDTLVGGGGADRFRFAVGGGHDVVADLQLAQGDRLFLALGQSYGVAASGGDALVTVGGGGDTILLLGVAPAALTGEWVVFG